jgi:high-affinity Fe2+/Pb2+ permease
MFALQFRSMLITLLLFVLAAMVIAAGAWARNEREAASTPPAGRSVRSSRP